MGSVNLLGLLVERSAVAVVSLRLGMTGTLPRNDFQASHWWGDDDFVELMRCSLTAQITCGAYFGTSNGGRESWKLEPTTADLGFTARLLPPTWTQPQPEYAGRCLMPT